MATDACLMQAHRDVLSVKLQLTPGLETSAAAGCGFRMKKLSASPAHAIHAAAKKVSQNGVRLASSTFPSVPERVRLTFMREARKPVKPDMANEAMTCCDALVSGVTLLTKCRGVAFNT